ncbi:HlyD family efflux transporter periplasmic adaptor subunit [Mycolicibacterium conceptionense]|uniref:HlyD family efflux transporter periplasmic adaptor subunit n=1 Tax=Mycolicibacterium conceptionense TaxID=451644 RepID=UPI003204D860
MPDDLLGKSVGSVDVVKDIYPHLLDVVFKLVDGPLGFKAPVQDWSLLAWTSQKIYDRLSRATILSALRADAIRSDIDNAIGLRQNAYITNYSPKIITQLKRIYSDRPGDASGVLPRLLLDLDKNSKTLYEALNAAYKEEESWGWGPVVKSATSETGMGGVENSWSQQGHDHGHVYSENSGGSSTESRGFEFRYPALENRIQYRRALVNLRPQYLDALRMAEMCKHDDVTFANELNSIDRQIKKLQVAYIDTILVAPFDGVVTGVFRSKGDYVTAGQPVVRVENDSSIYLVGTIKYRGLLRVGSQIKVSTTLFDTPAGAATEMEGAVCAVRGHDSIDEQWDIIIKCPTNRTPAGDTIFPLNYNFDYESTTVDVTAF